MRRHADEPLALGPQRLGLGSLLSGHERTVGFGLDGAAAETVLDSIGLTVNKQIIPDDPRPALRPSGIRLGTPAATTRGLNGQDMARMADLIAAALRAPSEKNVLRGLADTVRDMARRYPVPGLDT